MNEQEYNSAISDTVRKKCDIVSITPAGEDPVVYWHTVAQDAIKSAQKERERVKLLSQERDALKRDYERLTNNLVQAAADRRARPNRNPLDLSRLISMAGAGKLDLSVSLYISHHDGATGSEVSFYDETHDE